MPYDFSEPHHLPKVGKAPADPEELPRQRRGITPQMHGRYPDYDVLANADHWDEVTRAMILDRVDNPPGIRFFDAQEAETLTAFCDVFMHQTKEPRIPVLAYVDEKLFKGELDGYQYAELPDDRVTWRLVARGLDEQARARGADSFGLAEPETQLAIVGAFANAELQGGTWNRLNVAHAWSVVTRTILSAFYSHPWAWNEIGFGGPAYPRGYSRFGSPHLQGGEQETWEGSEALHTDPVRDTQERDLP